MRTPIVTREQVPEQFRAAFDRETANNGGPVDSGPDNSFEIDLPEGGTEPVLLV